MTAPPQAVSASAPNFPLNTSVMSSDWELVQEDPMQYNTKNLEPGKVIFRDSGLETDENLRQYYTVQRYVSRSGANRSAHIFKCNICSKSTRQFCNFKSHIRTHLDLKPYCCSICGKGFTTSSNCKFHLKTKTCLKMFR